MPDYAENGWISLNMQDPQPIAYKQKLSDDLVFKISRMKEVIKPSRPHKHKNYYELIFLTEGAGYHTIELIRHEVVPPVVFFLRPEQVHCWDFSHIPQGYVLLFREDLWLPDSMPGAFSTLPLELAPLVRLEGSEQVEYLERLIRNIESEMKASSPNEAMLCLYLNLILTKLHSWHATAASPVGPDRMLVDQFRRLLEKDIQDRQPVSAYAARLNTSVHKLDQVCKRELGATARQVIRAQVLLEAKRMLMHTHLSVSQVGAALDFHDTAHFIRFFKQQTRLTPGAYQAAAAGFRP